MWAVPETKDLSHSTGGPDEKHNLVSDGCDPKVVSTFTIRLKGTLDQVLVLQAHYMLCLSLNVQRTIVHWLKMLFLFYQKDGTGESRDVFAKVSKTPHATE